MNTLTIREDNLLNLNSYNKPVYYLISQEFYTTEVYDVLKKNDCHSGIREKKTEIIKIDTEEIDNLFEIIKEEEKYVYKIIHIHKQHNDVFKVGDVIYLDFGISFYTKTINGKIDKIEIFPTEIIKKEKILLYNYNIEIKMRELLDLMNDNYTENENYEKVKNCINSILEV
jgi:hypothetical protein